MNDSAKVYWRLETNEAAFCSIWADRIKINKDAQLFMNKKMPFDYFFNRLNLYEPEKPLEVITRAEHTLFRRALDCYVYVHEQNLELQQTLLDAGFNWIDTMGVMMLDREPHRQDNNQSSVTSVLGVDYGDIPTWVRIFCESFELSEMESEVQQRVELHFDKLILLISRAASGVSTPEAGGCCALFVKRGILGLYCLGTIPRFRGRGLARKMIGWVVEYNVNNNFDSLILQTFESQDLFMLYRKFGFQLAYKKRVYKKRRHGLFMQ